MSPATSKPRHLWVGIALSGLLAILVLMVNASFFQPSRLHINGYSRILVDQTYYTTGARNWLETGTLHHTIVFPGSLHQSFNRLWMPGHFYATAAAYSVFGTEDWVALVPNLVGYVLATMGTYLLGLRFFNWKAGTLAAAAFALFPPNVAFAYSAMAELTTVAAATIAAVAFVYLPRRVLVVAAPILLVLPFLFRETTAVLVVLLLAWMWRTQAKHWQIALAMALSVVCLLGVESWQVAEGKLPLNGQGGHFNYDDASSTANAESPLTRTEIFAINVDVILSMLDEVWVPESFACLSLVGCTLACLIGGWVMRRETVMPLGIGVLAMCPLIICLVLYEMGGFKYTRVSMFALPPTMAGTAGVAMYVGRRVRPAMRWAFLVIFALLMTSINVVMCRNLGEEWVLGDTRAAADESFIKDLNHDPDTLLVAPWYMVFDYAHRHYPARCSYVPKNDETLKLLVQAYPIDTMIVPSKSLGQGLTLKGIESESFFLIRRTVHLKEPLFIFKRSRAKPR